MTCRLKTLKLYAANLLTAALLLGSAAFSSSAPATVPLPASVRIENFTFAKPLLVVRPGTTVIWTNTDDIPHTVVSKDALFKSKVLDTGDRFSFTFAKPGQFGYFCSLHPHMTGTIVVKAGGTGDK